MSAALPHGGDLAAASLRYGHARAAWLDLSTGIAPWPYAVPPVPAEAWQRLPESAPATLMEAAERCYGAAPGRLLAVAGSVAAIRALPRVQLRWRSRARVVVAPLSFNEHAAAWARAGHAVRAVPWVDFDAALDEADVAIVCQPNNPTGDDAEPAQLLAWRERLAARGGWLVVDEAFRDTQPARSVIGAAGEPGLIVLRSLGKFFGLAGARVGFVATRPMLLDAIAEELGPWCISGPAALAAEAALRDAPWQAAQRLRLIDASQRLQQLCEHLGLAVVRSDHFVWTADACAAPLHEALARQAVWTRRFDVDGATSLRIGLPGDAIAWARLGAALTAALGLI
ncbi:MAG: threonine-phosphate decarboxylase CobD [Burkholderiales bacterium]